MTRAEEGCVKGMEGAIHGSGLSTPSLQSQDHKASPCLWSISILSLGVKKGGGCSHGDGQRLDLLSELTYRQSPAMVTAPSKFWNHR